MRLRLWARVLGVLVLAAVLVLAVQLLGLADLLPTRPQEDLSCHDLRYPSEIPNIEDARPPLQSIFFHETSCTSHKVGGIYLSPRQACAVESAALRNPGYQVYVLFAAPVSSAARSDLTDLLLQYKNVHFMRVFIASYANHSVVQSLPKKLVRSKYRVHHTSDLLRYLTLWRHPGVYLDMDVISAKGLEHMPSGSWAVAESKTAVAAGAIAFDGSDTGRTLAKDAYTELWESFDGSNWRNNGPGVLERVVERHCGLRSDRPISAYLRWIRSSLRKYPVNCTGFQVLSPELVYPVHWKNWTWYFEPNAAGRDGDVGFEKAVMYHFWGWLSDKHPPPPPTSPLARLARMHCPKTYNLTSRYF